MKILKINKLFILIFIAVILTGCNFLVPGEVPDGMISATTEIVLSHQHVFYIPVVDIENASSTEIYTSSMTGHTHDLILDDVDFSMLKQGITIQKDTTFTDNHSHPVYITYTISNN
jgi:hypothetical protein